jgi:hypothetical protein
MLQFYYEMIAEERIDAHHSKVHVSEAELPKFSALATLRCTPLSHRRFSLAPTDRQRLQSILTSKPALPRPACYFLLDRA